MDPHRGVHPPPGVAPPPVQELAVLAVLLMLLLAMVNPGQAQAETGCDQLHESSGTFQVAWVSPLRKKVHGRTWLDVVRVSQLREQIKSLDHDPLRTLQALGLVGPRGLGLFQARRYKVTVFDVDSNWLCRPVLGGTPGELVAGVAVCSAEQIKGARLTGSCGYCIDTVSGDRGPDVFRLRWERASLRGFCVLPWERFVSGA